MKKKVFRERRYGEIQTEETKTKRTKKNIKKKGKKND